MNAPIDAIDWDADAARFGRIELDGGITVVPETPLIGASVTGIDLREPLDGAGLASVTQAFLRYKVLMFRSEGAWRLDVDEHTRLCRELSEHWGIRPDTPQKQQNHSSGLTVHPFLPWQRGYPHIWPTSSVTGGGKQYELRASEDVENFEPFAANKRSVRKKPVNASSNASRKLKPHRPGQFGAAAIGRDVVKNGANGFHFDDGFFDQPPSAVVLNSIVLPPVGGDTIFTDMGAAFRGLPDEVQAWTSELTQTMDWRHAFPIWEQQAARGAEEGDDTLARRVETLIDAYPPSRQPLIRRHPVTGELSIYANQGFTRAVEDMEPTESDQILGFLYRMAERPEYQVRLRWNDVGDVCLYDNRITNHYAVSDYGDVGPRALHHIALLGEPTEAPDGKVVTWR